MATQEGMTSRDPVGVELQEVTNAMVRIYKDLFGRGPTKARSGYAGPDTLVVTLENGLTTAERNAIALGRHQLVRETRTAYTRASERVFIETVEQITGRTVRAFINGTDPEHDVSSAVIYFEPVDR